MDKFAILALPVNVKEDLVSFVPVSILEDVTCFVFYDNHPLSGKTIDITVCTSNNVVMELYQREVVSSYRLNCARSPLDILTFRNEDNDLFYLVQAGEELYILESRDEIEPRRHIDNVRSISVGDKKCSGEGLIEIAGGDDALPLVFDDKFETVCHLDLKPPVHIPATSPLDINLKRRLTQAQYCVAHNKRMLQDQKGLRHCSVFEAFQAMYPSLSNAIFKSGMKEFAVAVLRIRMEPPVIKTYQGSVILILELFNENDMSLDDIHILLHVKNNPAVSYTTKTFTSINQPPFWEEIGNKCVAKSNSQTTLTVAVSLKELRNVEGNNMEFKGVIVYTVNGAEKYLPFETTNINYYEIMKEDYNVLASEKMNKRDILALMAVNKKSSLAIRHLRAENEPNIKLHEALTARLRMKPVMKNAEFVVYKKTPHHILSGLAVVIEKQGERSYNVTLFARDDAQVLSFINCIQASIPLKLLITTNNVKITSPRNRPELQVYNEEITQKTTQDIDIIHFGNSIYKQIELVIEYYNNCLVEMGNSSDANVRKRLGAEIDLFADGVHTFMEFKKKLESEMKVSCNAMSQSGS